MFGEDGADIFMFSSDKDCGTTMATADQLDDFDKSTGDKIDLSEIDAITGNRTHDVFTFIGNNVAFTGVGQVRYADDYVEGNTGGDLAPEFYIKLNMALTPQMDANAFVFV